jgi:hypothetical protein
MGFVPGFVILVRLRSTLYVLANLNRPITKGMLASHEVV